MSKNANCLLIVRLFLISSIIISLGTDEKENKILGQDPEMLPRHGLTRITAVTKLPSRVTFNGKDRRIDKVSLHVYVHFMDDSFGCARHLILLFFVSKCGENGLQVDTCWF